MNKPNFTYLGHNSDITPHDSRIQLGPMTSQLQLMLV